MRHTIHTPTADFAYVESEFLPENYSTYEAVEEHKRVVKEVKEGERQGINELDFRTLYDLVAKGLPVSGDPGMLELLNGQQRFALNEAKKFIKRNQ